MTLLERVEYYSKRVIPVALAEGAGDTLAREIASQARLESGNFNSDVFKANNNLFGMKVPSIRKSPYILGAGSAAPSNEGLTPYAKYKNVEDSVHDLFHWLRYNHANLGELNTPEKYASFLKSKSFYGPDAATYAGFIKNFMTDIKYLVFKNPKTSILIALAGLTLIGTGIYIYTKKVI